MRDKPYEFAFNEDGSITVTAPDGTEQTYPSVTALRAALGVLDETEQAKGEN